MLAARPRAEVALRTARTQAAGRAGVQLELGRPRPAGVQTEQLPPQAIIRDRDTFFDQTHRMAERALERK